MNDILLCLNTSLPNLSDSAACVCVFVLCGHVRPVVERVLAFYADQLLLLHNTEDASSGP